MKFIDGLKDLEKTKSLIIEFTNVLNTDLGICGLENELQFLSSYYKEPEDKFLLAISDDKKLMGGISYKKFETDVCEIKRHYVKPEFRNQKIGDNLVKEIIKSAKKAGYKEMVLGTIEPLKYANKIYKKYGFKKIKPYKNSPEKDVIYMKLDLT